MILNLIMPPIKIYDQDLIDLQAFEIKLSVLIF